MKRASAQAHAKHHGWCSCGMAVRGNGGKYQHRLMHERKRDGHRYISEEQWKRKFAPAAGEQEEDRFRNEMYSVYDDID